MNDFDCYARWLNIPADRRPPNYYDLLGLPALESDGARIRTASMERTAYVRRFCLGQHGAEATKLLAELAAAFACLLDPTAKAAYDARLAAEIGAPTRSNSTAHAPLSRGNAASHDDDDGPPPIAERRHHSGGRLLPAAQLSSLRRRNRGKFPARLVSAGSLALVLLAYAAYRRHALGGGETAATKVAVAERHDAGKKPTVPQRAAPARPRAQPATNRRPAGVKQRHAAPAPTKPQLKPPAPSQTSGTPVDDTAAPLASNALPNDDVERDEMESEVDNEKERDEMESEAAAIAAPIPNFASDAITEALSSSGETSAISKPSPDPAGDAAGIKGGPPDDDEPSDDGEPPPSDGPPEPYSAGQVVGPMDSNGADGKFWRSRAAGRQQEWLELWFPRPVTASFLQIYLVEQPVTLDHIIIYPTTGEPIKMLPKRAPVDLFRSLLFTFGAHPVDTRHIKLVMHSPRAERLEIDAVALLTKSQERFWPEAAQVRTTFNQPADTDGPMFDEESIDASGHEVRPNSPGK